MDIERDKISYSLKKDARAKRVRISVYGFEDVVVTVPVRGFGVGKWGAASAQALAEEFVKEKEEWILKQVARFEKLGQRVRPPRSGGRREYLKYKEAARALAAERLQYFNQVYGFAYGRISIRNQKTRWGSCSRKGNLNFNYKIALLPPELADYIIVHELCHTKEFNHSKRFWALVAQTLPNYKELQKEVHKIGLTLS